MDYILNLRILLSNELDKLEHDQISKMRLESDIEIINSILQSFGSKIDIDALVVNKVSISICLDVIFDEQQKGCIIEFLNNVDCLKKVDSKINNIEEYMYIIDSLNNFKKLLEEKRIQKQIELKEISEIMSKIHIIRKILNYLIYRQRISKNNLRFICNFLEEKGVNGTEKLRILESINKNNVRIKNKVKNEEYLQYIDGINQMLEIGFEYYDSIKIDEETEIKILRKVNNLMKSYQLCYDINSLKEIIITTLKFDEQVYTYEEYKAFRSIFMNYIEKQMLDYINLIKDKDFYFDKESKIEILKENRKLIKVYSISRDFFEEQIQNYELQQSTYNSNDIEDEKPVNHLIFLNRTKDTFFESDLKDVPFEYLEKIIKLLEKFRTGKPVCTKSLSSNKKYAEIFELKLDQIRIILKHIQENYYEVAGVKIKKDNRDNILLDSLINRLIDIDSEQLHEYGKTENEIYDRIKQYCIINKRKGNR